MLANFMVPILNCRMLFYNSVGAFLSASQCELEAAYKRQLKNNFGIVFKRLYTLTNLPIGRFATYLRRLT